MTEQDGADADGSADAEPVSENATQDGTTTDDVADIDDIAEEPAGDADAAFEEILDDAAGDVEVDVDEEFVDYVADADPETLATELAALRTRVDALERQVEDREAEVDDLESRLARKQADFQNYKKRQEKRMEEEKARATEDLVSRLLDVRDNLQRALDQDEGADIRDGIESTLRQFDEELDRENVAVIEPDSGDDVDPQRHEVLMRVDSDQPEDTVADLHRPGYEMAGKVLRAAQVTVSDGPAEGEAGVADGSQGADSDDGESE